MKYNVYSTISRAGVDSFGIVTRLWAGQKKELVFDCLHWQNIFILSKACTPGLKSLHHYIE